jgi:hypothetical protein
MTDSASTSPKKDDAAIIVPAVGPVADKKDEAVKVEPAIADKK